MSLNYGLGENFTTVVPVLNGSCIFSAIGAIHTEYPNPPNHSKPYVTTSIMDSNSVIHFLNHSFNSALPTTDNIIEYYITLYNKTGSASAATKVVEFTPVLTSGSQYNYTIDEKARFGDYFTQHEIDNSSCFIFSVKRKLSNVGMGAGGNMMRYIILSPFRLVL